MNRVRQCLILAAGNGTRLRPISSGLPKPLVKILGKPILEHVILRACEAGIDNFVIVVGYRSELVRQRIESRLRGKASITWIENPEYHKANGISALKAKVSIQGNFVLLMADHLFESSTLRMLAQQRLLQGEVILAVDPNVDRIFDIDDATKVRREGNCIVEIGKELSSYDALDTGMFLCSPALFHHLESVMTDGNCSLTDGMRQFAHERRLRAVEIGEAQWQDLDTPEALLYAEGIFGGPTYHPAPLVESLVGSV